MASVTSDRWFVRLAPSVGCIISSMVYIFFSIKTTSSCPAMTMTWQNVLLAQEGFFQLVCLSCCSNPSRAGRGRSCSTSCSACSYDSPPSDRRFLRLRNSPSSIDWIASSSRLSRSSAGLRSSISITSPWSSNLSLW
uniref:(northern house mosquito) hypothetical protein n=1 Tax=Culex pipiens TaxID=7175 RepID=A0A8D8NNC5_CULPI